MYLPGVKGLSRIFQFDYPQNVSNSETTATVPGAAARRHRVGTARLQKRHCPAGIWQSVLAAASHSGTLNLIGVIR